MEAASKSLQTQAIRLKSDVIYYEQSGDSLVEEKYAGKIGLYCGLVMLFDTSNGSPLAIIQDGNLQQARVGAKNALGVKYLARENSKVVGMLGSGGQARSHLEAFATVRPIERCNVYSPTKANRELFATEMSQKLGIAVVAVDTPEEAVDGADIISCNTNSMKPILFPEMVRPGVHITVVSGEWDREVPKMFDVVPSSAESRIFHGAPPDVSLGRSGAAAIYAAASDSDLAHLVEISGSRYGELPPRPAGGGGTPRKTRTVPIADLIQGTAQGRLNDEEITSSTGLGGGGGSAGMSFVVVGKLVYDLALARGLGTDIPTDLFLQDVRN
ncbi:MAG: ornithine cyclodeaminase family protein [Chloroflexi bacterium]|nr:ornithine cyclodeaminase family protein [Chloroflexota bacterium]